MMDTLLEDMVRHARDLVRSYYGADLWEAEIRWDFPAQLSGDTWTEDDAKVSHAIGFIAGVAAAADLTPLMLLDEVRDVTPEVKRELHVAVAQLEGKVLDVPPAKRGTSAKKRQRIAKLK